MSAEQVKTEEQIPLTDAVAVPIVVEGGEAAPVAPEEPKPKKNWFTWGKKKGSAVINETNMEEGAVEEEPEKVKKGCWFKECTKTQPITIARDQEWGIDLVNRDHNNLTSDLDFHFNNVFAENNSQQSFDWVFRFNIYMYKVFLNLFYKLITLLIVPFGILFAILFAFTSAVYSFVLVPAGKLLIVPGNVLAAVWSWLIHAIFDPITSSLGLIFSNFNIRKYGINQENTAPCV